MLLSKWLNVISRPIAAQRKCRRRRRSEGKAAARSGSTSVASVSFGSIAERLEPRTLLTSITGIDDLVMVDTTVSVFEIGGATAGESFVGADDGYDQINVTNSLTVDGQLQISLVNGFIPSAGDRFDILTYGSSTGTFDSAEGLFGFGDGSLYFEIDSTSTGLSLVTRELLGGNGGSFLPESAVSSASLGTLLNADYFATPDPSLTISGTYSVGGFLEMRGTFHFAADVQETVTLANGTVKDVRGLSVGASDVDAFAGVGPYFVDSDNDGDIDGDDTPSADAIGVALTNLDLGLVLLIGSDLSSPPDPTTEPEAAVNYSARYLSLHATADSAAIVGTADLATAELRDLTVDINRATSPVQNPLYAPAVIDFSLTAGGGVEVATGDATNPTVLLTSTEALVAARAHEVMLEIGDFVQIHGTGLSIEKGPDRQVTLADGVTTKEVSVLTLGASGFDAFAGIGPYFVDSNGDGSVDGSDTPAADAAGLKLTNLNVGLALMAGSDITATPDLSTDPDGYVNYLASYVALTGTAERAEIVGTDDVLTAEILGLSIEVNQARSRVKVPGHEPAAINFSTLAGGGLTVPTGDATNSALLISSSDEILRAEANDVTLAVGDFVYAYGAGFSVEKGPNQTVTLADGATTKEVSVLTVGASSINAFVGIGPYFVDSNGDGTIDGADTPSSDAVGLAVENVNFGLALMQGSDLTDVPSDPQGAVDYLGKYYALSLDADSATLVGAGDVVTADIRDISVEVNLAKSSAETPLLKPSAINLTTFNGGGLSVPTGDPLNPAILLTSDDQILRATADDVTLALSDFVYVHGGGVAFEKGPDRTVTLASGTVKEVSVLTVGAANVDAFAGVGPYFVDSNSDGTIDGSDTPSSDAIGLAIEGLDFGFALMQGSDLTQVPTDPTQAVDYLAKYYALKGTADLARLVGVQDIATATLRNITLDVNVATSSAETPLLKPSVVNFATLAGGGLAIPTGDTADPSVLLDTSGGIILASVERATLDVAGTISLDGSIAVGKQASQRVTAAAGGGPRYVDVLTIGGENLYGFAGVDGPYRTDTNDNGVIDGGDTPNTNATGLALDGLTFGMALMRDVVGPNKYVGLKASTDTLQLVGVDGVTAVARNVDVAFNEVSPQPPVAAARLDVIDFTSFAGGQLAVETGGGSTVDLNFNERLLAASGDISVNVSNLVTVDGVFDFQLSPSKIFAYVDGTGSVGAGDLALTVQHVQGLLVIDDNGLGVDLDLSTTATLLGSISVAADMNLKANTSGQEYVYQVPDKFLTRVDYSSLTITAGAPRPDGSHAAPGAYVVLDGTGAIGIASTVDVTGDVYVYVTETELQVNAAGTLTDRAGILPAVQVAGDLFVSGAGMVGSLQIAAGGATSLFSTGAFSLSGVFQLEINTTGSAQSIQVLDISATDGSINGFRTGSIAANTLRVAGGMSLIVGPFSAAGAVELVFDNDGFTAALDAGVDVGFGTVHVVGQAAIINGAGGPIFAANLTANVELGVTDIAVRGAANLQINTSTTTAYAGVAADTYLVNVHGTLQVMLFKMENVDVTLSATAGVFRIDFDNLGLDFFGFVNVSVSGFVESDGDFQVIGSGAIPPLNLGPVSFNGDVSLDLRNSAATGRVLKGHLHGSGGLQISLPWPFEGSGAGATATLDGDITIGTASASVSITAAFTFSVTIGIHIPWPIDEDISTTFTETFSLTGGFSWSWGDPPIIARQIGDTVYLNMGVDGGLRGALYADLTSESYTITGTGEDITVQSLGQTMNFGGVKRIVATDAGAGNDFIYIGDGVSADVVLNGGDDNDSLTYLGTGTAIINGGAGNDVIRGGQQSDTLSGGSGADHIDGQAGADVITITGGADTVLGGQGNDQITVEGGTNTIYGGENDDTFIIRGGSSTVYGASGRSTLFFNDAGLRTGNTSIFGNAQIDTINVTMNSNGNLLEFNDHSFSLAGHTITFDDAVDVLNFQDNGPLTRIGSSNTAGGQLGASRLTLNASAIELNRDLTAKAVALHAPNGVTINDSLNVSGRLDDSFANPLGLQITTGSLTTTTNGSITASSIDVIATGPITLGAPIMATGTTLIAPAQPGADSDTTVSVVAAINASGSSLTASSTIDANTATWNVGGAAVLNDRVTVTDTFNVSAGSFATGSSAPLTAGSATLHSAGTADFASSVSIAGPMSVTSSSLTSTGTIDAGTASWTIGGPVAVNNRATVTGDLSVSAGSFAAGSSAPLSAASMTVSATGAADFGATVSVGGAMGVTSGSLAASRTIEAGSANWNVGGAVALADRLNVAGDVTVSAASFSAGNASPISAGRLTLATTGATWFGSTVNVTGAMNVTASSLTADGRIDAGSATWTVAGAVTLADRLTIGGALNVSADTLSASIDSPVTAGSVVASIVNATTFHAPVVVTGAMNVTSHSLTTDRSVNVGSADWDLTADVWTKDVVNVAAVISVRADTVLVDREITAGGLVVHTGDDVTLNAHPTVTGTMGFGQIGLLEIISALGLIDFTDQDFHVANGHLILSAGLGFTDTIRSEARAVTAINRGTGSRANITIREADSLNLLDAGLASGGVYSQNGTIDIELAAQDALLSLQTGVISTATSGQSIRLIADDFDFASGENMIEGTSTLVLRSMHDDIDYRLGSAGEDSSGTDQSAFGASGTAHIGVRDFAAIGDNFTVVSIGHASIDADGIGNTMTFGDIEDDPEIKLGSTLRAAKAALRNLTKFYADTVTVSGDVQAPSDRIEIHAHRAQIDSKNLHDQPGPDDSGLSGQSVLLELNEQLQHGGWIIGRDRVDIDVLNSNGTRPYFSFADELVSVKSDVGSRIATVNANSVIDIATSQSIQVAGVIEVAGTGAHADIATATKLTVLEGAVIAGRDNENVLTLDAGLLLSINPGGAVTAGARFVDVDGTPVAVQTGTGADAILNSPHELFIGGTVTTSDRMELNSGSPHFDHTDYFDGLAADHPLRGRREYGLLLTGTLTTLAADSELQLTSDADVIVRGNINVLGANSDLLVQSDTLTYIEGFLDVKDNVRILGGIEADGTSHNNTDPFLNSSVYVAKTAQVLTRDAGSLIEIAGASDADLFGVIVAGGEIGNTGVTFSGPGSAINVSAGEQVYLDTGLLASGSVTITAGTPGSDDTLAALFPGETIPDGEGDDLLSLVITTEGGITTAGITSDNSGGGILINAAGNIEMLGTLNAGANVEQIFENSKLIREEVTYSAELAELTINTAGRAFLGGHTFNAAGEVVQTGTYLRSSHAITVNGGSYRTGEGLLVHAASELTTNDPNGAITLTAEQDTTLLGLFVAGGRIDTVRDANGGYLGRTPVYYDGDSTVTLQAGGTIEIGQDIVAGQRIDLIGGSGGPSTGPGLTVQGSGRLITLRDNSQINLNAPGEVVIQPPGHINEISAQGFTVSSFGRLTEDITLDITVDRVDFVYSGTATLTAAATADNASIADLVADLQAALEAGDYTITSSNNDSRSVGDTFAGSEFADDPATNGIVDPDVKIKLRNGILLLTSPYNISVADTSVNSSQLGIDVSAGPLTSSRLYAIDAAQPGSIVNVGAPDGRNGKLSIGGKVRAYSAINLYSGTSPDGTDIDLGPTGVLETVDGSIAFVAGQYGDIRGTIIAGGAGSDIDLAAAQTLRIRGNLTADQDILLHAGSLTVPGEVSVQIDGTSHLNSTGGGGQIIVTGHNDIVFDGVFGTGSNHLALLELNAVRGNLTIPKTSGSIESDGLIALKGAVVDVQGVVRSTNTTADPTDFEITIDASDRAIINGDLQLTGSLRIDADNLVEVFNTTIAITEPDQRVVFSGGDVRFGKASTDDNGDPVQLGALVTAVDLIEFNAVGTVEIGSGSVIATSGPNSVIDLGAGSLEIAGSLLAGASVDNSDTVFSGSGADIVVSGRETVRLGGEGIIGGQTQSVGGTLIATGDITINVSGGTSDVSFTMDASSTLRSESVTDEPVGTSHNIAVTADQDIQIYGAIVAPQAGSDIALASGELIVVDGLLKAADQLTVVGGSDETGVGLIVNAFEFGQDANGDAIRLHGGTLTTEPGGSITIGADEKVVLSGIVGEVHDVAGVSFADVDNITVTKASNVLVMTTVNAADSIRFNATDMTIAPDSVIQTHASGGTVDLRASGQLLIGATLEGTQPALIQAQELVHLLGSTLSLDGQVAAISSAGRIVINAVDTVTLFGDVTSGDAIDVRAGVDANWDTAQLLGIVTVADLSGGDILIDGGTLRSSGETTVLAGSDVTVVGATTVGSDPVPVRRPVIITTPQTIEVITGTRQVAVGSILVPEVTFVTTTTTEQVGTESVRVGSAFNTADITLTQLGYYNPNASTGNQYREYFVDGVDYRKNILANADFESPSLGAGGYQYGTSGSPWTFTGGAGIASNGSAFNIGTAPSGRQVGFIQSQGRISRTVNVTTAGEYLITLATMGRNNGQSPNPFQVLVDGVVVATITPPTNTRYDTVATPSFSLSAGSHEIAFQGLTGGIDVTSFVDAVSLARAVDWSKVYDPRSGEQITLSQWTAPLTGTQFGALTDNQRDSVLIHLGYRKFYNASFANLETHNTINGIPSTQPWQPDWYNATSSASVVGAWQASGNSSDSAGEGINGVLRGGVTYGSGRSGQGFAFNGAPGTGVLVANDPTLQINEGTVDAWIRTTDTSAGYHGIVVKQFAYGLFVNGGKLVAFDWSTGSMLNTNHSVADGQLHHVAMTFNSGVTGGTVLYVDGVSVLTTTSTVYSHAGHGLAIGSGFSNASSQNFNGVIDEVHVWNRVLTGSEIAGIAPTSTVITQVPVDGWRDKHVRMPAGSELDIQRMVSQGEPETFAEDTADTWLETDVKLHQIGWYNPATGEGRRDTRAAASSGFTAGAAYPGAGWQEWYRLEYLGGERTIVLADGRTLEYSDPTYALPGQPDWSTNTAGWETHILNGRYVELPPGAQLNVNTGSSANRQTAALTLPQTAYIPINYTLSQVFNAPHYVGAYGEYLGTYADPILYTFFSKLSWSGSGTDYDLHVFDGGTSETVYYANRYGTNLTHLGDLTSGPGNEQVTSGFITHDAHFTVSADLFSRSGAFFGNDTLLVEFLNWGNTSFYIDGPGVDFWLGGAADQWLAPGALFSFSREIWTETNGLVFDIVNPAYDHGRSAATHQYSYYTDNYWTARSAPRVWDQVQVGTHTQNLWTYVDNGYWVDVVGPNNDYWQQSIATRDNVVTIPDFEDRLHYQWHNVYQSENITDRRSQLSYQLVTTPTGIYDLRPKFETGESTVKVVAEKSVTQWETQNITESQTVLTTSRETADNGEEALQGAYGAPSIDAAGSVTIAAGNNVAVHGVVQSTGLDQTLSIAAGLDAVVDGVVPDGAPAGTLPAVATLLADGRIQITSGRDVTLGASSRVAVDEDGVAERLSEFVIDAGQDINLSGLVSVGHLIDGAAGLTGTGSIIGDINAELSAFDGAIVLAAGNIGGDVVLTGTAVDAGGAMGDVSLSAAGGTVQQTGSIATGRRFTVRAASGVTANTNVSEFDVRNTLAGDVTLLNFSDVSFVDVLRNAGGLVNVLVFGNVAMGSVDTSDDVTVQATGQFSQHASTTINGRLLTLDASEIAGALNTSLSFLTLSSAGTGNVVVHNSGSQPLEIDITVTDGGLTVDTVGDLLVRRAVSLTDSDSHDITLSSGGDLVIDLVQAGDFAATAADARRIRLSQLSGALRASGFLSHDAADLDEAWFLALDVTAARVSLVTWLTADIFAGQTDVDAKAEAEADRQLSLTQPIHAEGDVTLSADGAIREWQPEDADVDLIADSLTITSGLGVSGLETSLNRIASLHNISGLVEFGDVDSVGELARGLTVDYIRNDNGSVVINIAEDLEVSQISGLGATGDVTLTSDKVLRLLPVTGVPETVVAGHDLTLYSVDNLYISGGITAPNAVSVSSAADVKLSGTTLNLSTAAPIEIESDSSLSITGVLESATGVSLVSNHGDVEVIGHIRGRNGAPLEYLTIVARGNLMKSGEFAGQYRFRSLVDDATYYANTAELVDSSVVIDASGLTVDNFSERDLVPYTTTDAPVIKDPDTGLDYFRDPTTGETPATQQRYLRYIGGSGEEFYRRTDPVTGYYPFSAIRNETTLVTGGVFDGLFQFQSLANGDTFGRTYHADSADLSSASEVVDTNNHVVADVASLSLVPFVTQTAEFIELLYSTTEDPTQGTLYADDGVTEIDPATISNLETTLVEVTDSDIIARLLPFTLKDANNGRATGTSISLQDAEIGTVSGAVTFIAHGQVLTPTFTLDGPGSSITVIAGEDLETGTWRAENVSAQSTGIFDAKGSFIGGNIVVSQSFRTASNAAPETVSLTALNDITLNAPVTPRQSLQLLAGGTLANLPDSIAMSGVGSSIELSASSDLRFAGSLSANGSISLVSTGNRGPGGEIVVEGNVASGAGPIWLMTNSEESRISGVISGAGGLTLSGGGTLTLDGANTCTGTTQVISSRLVVSGSTAGGSDVVLSNGSTLSGTGSVGGSVTIQDGGTLSPGHSPGILQTGDLSLDANATFVVEIGGLVAGAEYDQVSVTGSVSLHGADLLLIPVFGPFPLRKDDQFVLIRNDGTDSVSGRLSYAGSPLEEGGVVHNFLGTGRGATITYVGNADRGSVGNDVILTIINTPPVAFDDEAATSEDGPVTFNVLANDTDIENNIDPSSTISLTSPVAGMLTSNHDGTFTYDPNGEFESLAVTESTTVTFDYRVIDEFDDSDVGTVTLTINGVNDAPTINVAQDSVTIDEGQTVTNAGGFGDIDFTDRPTITASIGTVSQDDDHIGAWNWSFDALDGPTESQIVTVTVDDHHGGVATTTFELIVNNVAPTIETVNAPVIDENGIATISGLFTDASPVDTHTVQITWGDGTRSPAVVDPATRTFMASHQYRDDNPTNSASDVYDIGVTVTDDDTGSDFAATTVTVNNVAPVIEDVNAPVIDENGTATITGRFTDIGLLDTHTVQITWGDGTRSPAVVDPATRTFTASHQYRDDNPTNSASDVYDIGVTVTDDDTGSDFAATTVTVNNVVPVIEDVNAPVIDENGTATITGRFTDIGLLDTHTVQITWGDGTRSPAVVDPATRTFRASHQYRDDNPTNSASDVYDIGVTVTDDDTGSDFAATTVTVNNVAPTLSVSAVDIQEHGTTTLSGTITDIGLLDTHEVGIDWSDSNDTLPAHFDLPAIFVIDPADGSLTQVLGTAGQTEFASTTEDSVLTITAVDTATGVITFTVQHQYLDDDPTHTPTDIYEIVASVTDDDTASGNATTTFLVSNVAPEITLADTDASTLLGRSKDKTVVLSGLFVDVGTLDTHTAVVDWGDGSPLEQVSIDAATRAFNGTHTYLTGGIFAITVTVTDDDGLTSVSSTSAVVEGVGLVDGTLYIIGTDGRDHVNIKANQKKGELNVDVKLNQGDGDGGSDKDTKNAGNIEGSDGGSDRIKGTYAAADVNRVIAFLFDGDDHYDGGSDGGSATDSDAIPQMVFGGNGNDHISGGRGNNALFGGSGNDDIKGGSGSDILIGDDGRDKLQGGQDNDLLIGGSLDNDFDDLSIIDDIDQAMSEWAAGSLADTLLALGSVVDDNEKDDLKGEKGANHLVAGSGDKLK
jgi:hypothetical protein